MESSSFLLSCPGYVSFPTHPQLILQDEQAALSPHTQNTGGEVVKPPASVTLTFPIFQNPLTDKISESQFSHMQILLGL